MCNIKYDWLGIINLLMMLLKIVTYIEKGLTLHSTDHASAPLLHFIASDDYVSCDNPVIKASRRGRYSQYIY